MLDDDVTVGSASALRKNSKQMAKQRALGTPDRSAGRRRLRRGIVDVKKFMSVWHFRDVSFPDALARPVGFGFRSMVWRTVFL